MGNNDSKQVKSPFVETFKNKYSMVQENYEDPRFGRINVYQGQDDLVMVKKSFNHGNDQEYFSQDNYNTNVMTLSQCPYLLKLYGYSEQKEQAMCGSVQDTESYHEYLLNNLEAEIQQRNRTQLYYQETELWVILYSIISASTFLQSHKKHINDVRPQNIYITLNGQLKIVPFGCFPDDTPAFNKTQTFATECYLAPEQLSELRKKSLNCSTDPYKADIYSTGMTLLQCCTLISTGQCYDFDNYALKQDVIDYFLQQASQRYSKFLVNLIKLLLENDPKTRLTPLAVEQILFPYENQILNLQPFNPQYQTVKQSLTTTVQQQKSVVNQPSSLQPQQQEFKSTVKQSTQLPQQQDKAIAQGLVGQSTVYQQQFQYPQTPVQQLQPLQFSQPQTTVQQQQLKPLQFQQSQPPVQSQPQKPFGQSSQLQINQPKQQVIQEQQVYKQPTLQPQTQAQQQQPSLGQPVIQQQYPQQQPLYSRAIQGPTTEYVRPKQEVQQQQYQEKPQYQQQEPQYGFLNQAPQQQSQYIQPQPRYQEEQPQSPVQQYQQQYENYPSNYQQAKSPIRQVSQGPYQPVQKNYGIQQQQFQQQQDSPVQYVSPQVQYAYKPPTEFVPSQGVPKGQLPPQYQNNYQAQNEQQQVQSFATQGNNDYSDIDRRINDVLNRTKNTLEKVENQEGYDQNFYQNN